jgi:hypothetical protein
MKTKKLTYDDIQLMGKVRLTPLQGGGIGEIRIITNYTDVGIDEPIFTVLNLETKRFLYFGFKYILKHYIIE